MKRIAPWLLLVIPAGLIWWAWGPQIGTAFVWFLHVGAIGYVPLVVLIGLLAAALYLFDEYRNGIGTVFGVAFVLALIAAIVLGVRFEYDQNRIYAADADVVDVALPEFAERAPFDVAVASSKRNLGDTTGEALNVKALSDQGDHGVWSALVERRGWFEGYEAVQVLDVPLYGATGAADAHGCMFNVNRANHKLDGVLPHNSLDYLILANTPWTVWFDRSDAYAYCDGDTPKVVVPLKQINGFWLTHETPYGAAVYDGSTGKLSVLEDTSAIPGPVYPQSIAVKQRYALGAIESWEDWFFARAGYEDTSGDGEGNPNIGNESEFTLRYLGTGESAYVTPLTPRGDSSSVVALSVTDASTATFGERNPIVVYRYPAGEARAANSSIAQELKSTYSWMPDWASGLTIFEIVPGADGALVASIGQAQSVVYRAVISADGRAVMYDSAGRELVRAPIPTPAEPTNPGTNTGQWAELTPQELRDLIAELLDELAARASGANR